MYAAAQAGIDPQRFWQLTPREVRIAVQAHAQNFRSAHQLLAWHAAATINPHVKKPITGADLMGRKKKGNEFGHAMFMTREDWLSQFKKRREERDAKAFWGEKGRAPAELLGEEEGERDDSPPDE